MPEGCPEELALGGVKILPCFSTQSSQMKPHTSVIPGEAKKKRIPSDFLDIQSCWMCFGFSKTLKNKADRD